MFGWLLDGWIVGLGWNLPLPKELRVEELGKRHAEAFGYLLQVDCCHVALAGLHLAEVGARHAYEVGELLLAHPALGAQLLDAQAYLAPDVVVAHAAPFAFSSHDSLRPAIS